MSPQIVEPVEALARELVGDLEVCPAVQVSTSEGHRDEAGETCLAGRPVGRGAGLGIDELCLIGRNELLERAVPCGIRDVRRAGLHGVYDGVGRRVTTVLPSADATVDPATLRCHEAVRRLVGAVPVDQRPLDSEQLVNHDQTHDRPENLHAGHLAERVVDTGLGGVRDPVEEGREHCFSLVGLVLRGISTAGFSNS